MTKNLETKSLLDYKKLRESLDARNLLVPQDIQDNALILLKRLEDTLQEEIELMHIEALRLADLWREMDNNRDKATEPPTFLTCKIQRLSNMVYIEWRRLFIRKNSARIVKKLDKSGFIYNEKQFAFVPEWARDFAIDTERKFRGIRERNKIVSDMLRELKKYRIILEKNFIK